MTGTITVNGARLAYSRAGQGRSVLLLHGWTCNRGFWRDQIDFLSRDHQVVALDFRGHGQSQATGTGNTIGQLAQDALGVIQGLDLGRVVLAGHSMGGMVAQRLALDRPDRLEALILVTTIAADLGDNLISKRILAESGQGYGRAFNRHFAGWLDPAADTALVDWARREMLRTPERVALDLVESYRRFDLRAELPRLKLPTLVIGAASDASAVPVEAEILAALIPAAELVVLEKCGHFPMLEAPERLNATMAAFLARHGL